jgi:ribosomal protein L12E/L44/L45/RPP1/RPP2
MVLTSLTGLSASQKNELVASLAVLVVGNGVTADAITAVATASGNSLDASYAALFSSVVDSAGGIDKFCAAPGSGGGGGSAAAGGEAAAAEEVVEEEEEEEADIGGAVDMFGGGDAAGGDY